MTEKSYYWSNKTVGDGIYSPYSDDEFSDIWRILFLKNRATQGTIDGYGNELEVTNPSGNNIQVDTGAALVDGKFYEADAAIALATISTPTAATRKDRVVLRKDWSAQTIRAAIVTGDEGAGVKSLDQRDGIIWEIPLATVTITTGATITITDERENALSPLGEDLPDGAWVLIEEIESDGTETSIDFSSIPDTYRELVIIGVLRHQRAATVTEISLRLNDDSGANYDHQYFNAANAAASSSGATGDNEAELGVIPAASATASHFGLIKISIPYYANTNFYKNIIAHTGSIPNATVNDYDYYDVVAKWNSEDAVDTITLFSSGAAATEFAQYSIFSLYGVV